MRRHKPAILRVLLTAGELPEPVKMCSRGRWLWRLPGLPTPAVLESASLLMRGLRRKGGTLVASGDNLVVVGDGSKTGDDIPALAYRASQIIALLCAEHRARVPDARNEEA